MRSENVRSEGPEDAAVTTAEVADFLCPFGRRAQAELAALRDEYEDRVRLAFKDLPLPDIHSEAVRAAMAARCTEPAREVPAFQAKPFEFELFADENFEKVAQEVGAKAEKLMRCLNEGATKHDVERG